MSRKGVQGFNPEERWFFNWFRSLTWPSYLVSKASNERTPINLTLTWLVDQLIFDLEGSKAVLEVRRCLELGQLEIEICLTKCLKFKKKKKKLLSDILGLYWYMNGRRSLFPNLVEPNLEIE